MGQSRSWRDDGHFTSGGTEANNLAIRGSATLASTRVAVTTAVDYPATTGPLGLLAAAGWSLHTLAVDSAARADPAAVPDGPIGLATVILAQNEVGTIQPFPEIAQRVHDAGSIVHADAAQAVGKIPVNVDDLCVDLLSIAGHKLYAPKGIGALSSQRASPPRRPARAALGRPGRRDPEPRPPLASRRLPVRTP